MRASAAVMIGSWGGLVVQLAASRLPTSAGLAVTSLHPRCCYSTLWAQDTWTGSRGWKSAVLQTFSSGISGREKASWGTK